MKISLWRWLIQARLLAARTFQLALTWVLLTTLMLGVLPASTTVAAAQIDIFGPAGNPQFGKIVTVLSSGNIVVTDPTFSMGATANVGAVYLYDGRTGALISALTGSRAGDSVGKGTSGFDGITALPNGNYVVSSPLWSNGGVIQAGAVTWCSGTTGCAGEVSASNSLVGSKASDWVGISGTFFRSVTVLANGNYVVSSPSWNNGAASDAGAVTWCSGTTGCTGALSASNSLVGGTTSDGIGGSGITALTNGNYVVVSRSWNNGSATQAGAVTWCSGTAGCTGQVSPSNSLVGSTAYDWVGNDGTALKSILALPNGNYVVRSTRWNTFAGAVTWCSGTTGCTGEVSASNSLVGSKSSDTVGDGGGWVLPNGNYVIASTSWSYRSGAATWCSGTTGCTGAVSASNSLVGSYYGFGSDQVSSGGVTVLPNGNYVVSSNLWFNGEGEQVGAATWCHGTMGCTGSVSPSNSLVGSSLGDAVYGPIALANGNYVVRSWYSKDGAAPMAGAVTWCSGIGGCTGEFSASNSLVGSTAYDRVGAYVAALANGNYVIASSDWDNGAASDAGAVTWCSGTAGCTGPVSASNSLVGSSTNDQVGRVLPNVSGIAGLPNGSYVVGSPSWQNGGAAQAGAATWCSGTAGCTGPVSASNSLVGSAAYDKVGSYVAALANGNYVVASTGWNNGAVSAVGAVTWCRGAAGCAGPISASTSLVGSRSNDSVGYGSSEYDGILALTGGNYVVRSYKWNNGAAQRAGAVTWCDGTTGCSGAVSTSNSVLGAAAGGGATLTVAFDEVNKQLVVGRPADNRVTLFKVGGHAVYLPLVARE